MYIVTVKFHIKPEYLARFMPAIIKQAEDSLTLEDACTQFDISTSENDPNLVFLYEIYNSKADFDVHLASAHFKSFSEKVGTWVSEKHVETFNLV